MLIITIYNNNNNKETSGMTTGIYLVVYKKDREDFNKENFNFSMSYCM